MTLRSEYTPTTDEIIRSFAIPPHRIIKQEEGESFAEYLSRMSIEGHGYQMESERAAHRWLSEHDRQVAERARIEFADELTRKGVHTFNIHDIRRYAKETS